MKISKTLFKEYSRCPRVCALDDIYKKKMQTNVSIFGEDDTKDNLLELLGTMYDIESGEDLLDIVDPQLEALLPYYNVLEKHAIEVAKHHFGQDIIFDLDTKKQKSFSYVDTFNHQYYCYLDGYQETKDEVRVFEVKATTSKKFLELGPKMKGIQKSILKKRNHLITLDQTVDIDKDKFTASYEKLFNRFSGVGRYAFDLAVERYIIENSINFNASLKSKKFSYYLVVLNSDYIFDGEYKDGELFFKQDENGNDLVVFIDLTEVTHEYLSYINTIKKRLVAFINELKANEVKLGTYCERKKQGSCLFIGTCWEKALEKGSILEYMQNHHGFKDEYDETHKTLDLLNEGVFKITDIPKHWLKRTNNQIQRMCFEENIEYINSDKIKKGIGKITYPIYHLDFESFPCPLPRFKGEKPYNQSVFQFSLHVERQRGICDKDKDHLEFLAPDFNDHRERLVQQLVNMIDLSQGGTVLVYNKSFEHTRIKEFAELFPQYKEALKKINDHMFDLIDIVQTNSKLYHKELGFSEEEGKTVNYYHNDLRGSYSIKKVLPLFSELSYQDLEVANGTQAIAAYANFPHMEAEDLDLIRQQLIEYCKQDTWAMVLVLWGLMKKVELLKN